MKILFKLFRTGMKGFEHLKSADKGDMPELTNFLKQSQGFKSLSWKIFHFKNDVVKKLDQMFVENDDGPKKIHKMKKIDNNANSSNNNKK